MARHLPRTVPYRRVREQRTNYKKRLKLLLSRKPRLVVRLTNQRLIGQMVLFASTGDKVIVGADSLLLRKQGWPFSCKNIPAAYLTGYALGKKALANNLKEAVLDTGWRTAGKKGKLYAFLQGVVDAGVQVPHSKEVFPEESRLQGAHLTQHLKNKAEPEQVTEIFNQVKKKLS